MKYEAAREHVAKKSENLELMFGFLHCFYFSNRENIFHLNSLTLVSGGFYNFLDLGNPS